jgi:hypothetical protein
MASSVPASLPSAPPKDMIMAMVMAANTLHVRYIDLADKLTCQAALLACTHINDLGPARWVATSQRADAQPIIILSHITTVRPSGPYSDWRQGSLADIVPCAEASREVPVSN